MRCLLLLAIWLGINTGPEIFEEVPSSLLGFAHWARTAFPFLALLPLPVLWTSRARLRRLPYSLRMWILYCVMALAGITFSPFPHYAIYWIICYLSVFAVAYWQLQQNDPLERLKELNQWGWIVASVFLSIMAYIARDTFAAAAGSEGSFYGAYGQMDTVAEMAMSRSSGLARFAAIPGLVAFVACWRGRLLARVIGLFINGICAWFIWQLQSRGAIFAFAGAVVVSMLVLGTGTRLVMIMGLLMAGLLWSTKVIAPDTVEYVGDYLRRGQSVEEFESMTGRTQVWAAGLQVAAGSPFVGYGPQADRFLMNEHIHNTYMYALVCGGIPGLVLFVVGLIAVWRSIIRLAVFKNLRHSAAFTTFVQCAALMTFFTIRSVTEVCGSLFAVDLMIMVPAMAYIGLLDQFCFPPRASTSPTRRQQPSPTGPRKG